MPTVCQALASLVLPSGLLLTSALRCSTPPPLCLRIQGPFSPVPSPVWLSFTYFQPLTAPPVLAPFILPGTLISFGLTNSYSSIKAPVPMAPCSEETVLVLLPATHVWAFPGGSRLGAASKWQRGTLIRAPERGSRPMSPPSQNRAEG